MSNFLEIRERQKMRLQELLEMKLKGVVKNNDAFQEYVKRAITPMEQEDVAWVEKIVGIKWDS